MNKFSPVSKQCQSPLSVERLKHKQLQKRLHIQEQLSKEIGQVYDDLLKEHQQILQSHEDLKEEVKALRADRRLLQAADLENQRLHQHVEDLENEKSAIESRRISLEKINSNLEKELDGLYKELAEITNRATAAGEREINLKEDLKIAKDEIKDLSNIVQSHEILKHQYGALENEFHRMKKMVDRTEADAKTQYEDLRRDHEEVMKTIRESQQAALTQLTSALEEKDHRIAELIAQRDEAVEEANSNAGISEEEATQLKEQFEQEARLLRSHLSDKTRENQQLKNDMNSHMHNYMRVSEDYKECKRALIGKDDLIDDLRRENAALSQELAKLNSQYTSETKRRINIEARANEYKDHLNKQLVKQRVISHYETTTAGCHFNSDLQKLDDAILVGERPIKGTKSVNDSKPVSSIVTRPISSSTPRTRSQQPHRTFALSRGSVVSGGSSGMTWLSYPNENYDPESQQKIDKIRSMNKRMAPHMRSSFNAITG
ncbi:hypothetical protein FO519_010079, partial [Halicephalobus sp. NKZ332]